MRKEKKSLPIWLKIAIPCVLLAGVIVGVIFAKGYRDAKDSVPDGESESFVYATLWDYDHSEIKTITNTMRGQAPVTIYSETEDNDTLWYFADHPTRKMDRCYLNWVSTACSMQVYELIREDITEEDKAIFGLANPFSTFDIELQDGSHTVMYMGDVSLAGNYCYIMMEGDPNVYSTSSAYHDYAAYTELDLSKHTLTDVYWNNPWIILVQLKKKDERPLCLVPFDPTKDYPDNNMIAAATLGFVEPYYDNTLLVPRSDLDTFFRENKDSVTTDELIQFDATLEELKAYGLDPENPEYFVNIGTMGEDKDENGGNRTYGTEYCFGYTYGDNNEYVYVCEYGDTTVYGTKIESLTQFDFNPYTYLKQNVFVCSIDDIVSLTLDFNGETYKLTASPYEVELEEGGTSVNYDVQINGKQLDRDDGYRSLLTSIAILRHSGEIWEDNPAHQEECITIHYHFADETERLLTFYKVDDQTYIYKGQDGLWLKCGSYQFKELHNVAKQLAQS